MNNLRKTSLFRKIAVWCMALILAVAALSAFSGLFAGKKAAAAYETNTFTDFPATAVGLENPQFANHSGNLPAAPSGWTETAFDNQGKGATVMGVIDLDIYDTAENRENAKLTEYPEYESDIPLSPFGNWSPR